MSALACLRVVIEAEVAPLPETTLGPLVEKLTGAYLETRWLWPRAFSALTHYAFLLTDPRADEMDVRELVKLSEELQAKLFGKSNSGKVALLLFEGPADSVRAFAALDGEGLAQARRDPARLPSGGRLAQLLSEDLVTETAAPETPPPSPQPPAEEPPADHVRLHGVYFRARKVFIGDVVSSLGAVARDRATITDGADRLPEDPQGFDAFCIEAARKLLVEEDLRSTLYIPLSYDSLVRPSRRAALTAKLAELPADRSAQLAAAIYGVPRDPPFGAMSAIRKVLGRTFERIDLRIDDPAFEVEKVPPGIVAGVSFALPLGDRRARLAALRRFVARRRAYKQRRIWGSITNVRTLAELEACEALGVPFVTGPAVCDPQSRPLAGRVATLDQMPIRVEGDPAGQPRPGDLWFDSVREA